MSCQLEVGHFSKRLDDPRDFLVSIVKPSKQANALKLWRNCGPDKKTEYISMIT